MQSLRLITLPDALLFVDHLPLRLPQVSGWVDPEPFRAQARGDAPPPPERLAQSGGMRALHLPEGLPWPSGTTDGPRLMFVISGALVFRTGNRGTLTLQPGDLVLLEASALEQHALPLGDCRLIEVRVTPDWPDPKARSVDAPSTHPRDGLACKMKRMIKADDDRSVFRDFTTLFCEPGIWSPITPLVGFRFLGMTETFIDWHPEVVNNFVIVLSGALELEVGGEGGSVEIFREGDVCLAEDRTGEGHIDRTHGLVQVAILVVADGDLWQQAT